MNSRLNIIFQNISENDFFCVIWLVNLLNKQNLLRYSSKVKNGHSTVYKSLNKSLNVFRRDLKFNTVITRASAAKGPTP